MPFFKEVQQMQQLVVEQTHLVQPGEEALEALVRFNQDLQILGANALQLQQLLEAAVNENAALLAWTQDLERLGEQAEEEVYRVLSQVEQAATQIHDSKINS